MGHAKRNEYSRKFHDILFKKLKSRIYSKNKGPKRRIISNYICKKQNVDVGKDRVSITAIVITIENSRIS